MADAQDEDIKGKTPPPPEPGAEGESPPLQRKSSSRKTVDGGEEKKEKKESSSSKPKRTDSSSALKPAAKATGAAAADAAEGEQKDLMKMIVQQNRKQALQVLPSLLLLHVPSLKPSPPFPDDRVGVLFRHSVLSPACPRLHHLWCAPHHATPHHLRMRSGAPSSSARRVAESRPSSRSSSWQRARATLSRPSRSNTPSPDAHRRQRRA